MCLVQLHQRMPVYLTSHCHSGAEHPDHTRTLSPNPRLHPFGSASSGLKTAGLLPRAWLRFPSTGTQYALRATQSHLRCISPPSLQWPVLPFLVILGASPFIHSKMIWCQGLPATWDEFQNVFWTLVPDHRFSSFLKGFLESKACSITNHPGCSLSPRWLTKVISQ